MSPEKFIPSDNETSDGESPALDEGGNLESTPKQDMEKVAGRGIGLLDRVNMLASRDRGVPFDEYDSYSGEVEEISVQVLEVEIAGKMYTVECKTWLEARAGNYGDRAGQKVRKGFVRVCDDSGDMFIRLHIVSSKIPGERSGLWKEEDVVKIFCKPGKKELHLARVDFYDDDTKGRCVVGSDIKMERILMPETRRVIYDILNGAFGQLDAKIKERKKEDDERDTEDKISKLDQELSDMA